jgi:hypothetical protein
VARKHLLDIYAHIDDPSCVGCFDEEAQDAAGAAAPPPAASAGDAPPRAGETGPVPEPSGPVAATDFVEVTLTLLDDRPIRNARFELQLADGSTQQATTDADGHFLLEGIPPGTVHVKLVEDGEAAPAPGAGAPA